MGQGEELFTCADLSVVSPWRSPTALGEEPEHEKLFQHGNFHPYKSEWRSQRLERLFKRLTEMIESGVWIVGEDNVEGLIDNLAARIMATTPGEIIGLHRTSESRKQYCVSIFILLLRDTITSVRFCARTVIT